MKLVPPEWLINPETTDNDKRPLDPRAVARMAGELAEQISAKTLFSSCTLFHMT